MENYLIEVLSKNNGVINIEDTTVIKRQIKRRIPIDDVPLWLEIAKVENEPIVESPSNAIDTFLKTQMDVLVLENYVISRK